MVRCHRGVIILDCLIAGHYGLFYMCNCRLIVGGLSHLSAGYGLTGLGAHNFTFASPLYPSGLLALSLCLPLLPASRDVFITVRYSPTFDKPDH